MSRSGHDFYLSENGIWLTCAVPASYLRFLDAPENHLKQRKKSA
jgi:RNA:NAD 2'-phosphotransferase (TPT1/KptA family)